MAEPLFRKEVNASLSKKKILVASSRVAFAKLPGPTDSKESEKETTSSKRPWQVRAKKKPKYKASDTDSRDELSITSCLRRGQRVRTEKPKDKVKTSDRVSVAANVVTETAPKAIRSLTKDKDKHKNNSNINTLLLKPAPP
jgi:hypothetical protein